jgi:hypothetical protein
MNNAQDTNVPFPAEASKKFSDAPNGEVPIFFDYGGRVLDGDLSSFGLDAYGSMPREEIYSWTQAQKESKNFENMFGLSLPTVSKIFEKDASAKKPTASVLEGEENENAVEDEVTTEPCSSSQTKTTTKMTKRKKKSSSYKEVTTTTTTTTMVLPDGTTRTTETTDTTDEQAKGEGDRPKPRSTVGRVKKRRRRLSPVSRKKKRELEMQLLRRALEAYEESSCASDDEELAEEGEEGLAEEEHEESSQLVEMEARISSMDEISQKKSELDGLLSKVQEALDRLRNSREDMAVEYEELSRDQKEAKIRYEDSKTKLAEAQHQFYETEQAWSDISHRRQNKKIRMIKVDADIESSKRQMDSIRTSRRELGTKSKDVGLEALRRMMSPLLSKIDKTLSTNDGGRGAEAAGGQVASKKPRNTGHAGKTSLSSSGKRPMEPSTKFVPDPLLETTESWESTESSETSGTSSSSSSDDSSSESESSGSEYMASEATSEDEDVNGRTTNRPAPAPKPAVALDWEKLTPEQIEQILESGDATLLAALSACYPESEDKPFANGVILNDSTCVHCGLCEPECWSMKDPRGFVCPDCVCVECGLPRDQCKHEEFWTEHAMVLPVKAYVKRGVSSKKKLQKWTRLSKAENIGETIVDKYNRMRETPKDSENYSGRKGVENEFKRWYRRYIIHSFTEERLLRLIYNIFAMDDYVNKNKKSNPDCKPYRCIICNCRFVYNNEEREPGSMSTTGNGTSHRCCTGCKNFFSNTYQKTFTWCNGGRKQYDRSRSSRRKFLAQDI